MCICSGLWLQVLWGLTLLLPPEIPFPVGHLSSPAVAPRSPRACCQAGAEAEACFSLHAAFPLLFNELLACFSLHLLHGGGILRAAPAV